MARRNGSQVKSPGKKTRRQFDKEFKQRAVQMMLDGHSADSRHTLGYNENVLLDARPPTDINQVWVGDITYIPLRQSFGYLSMLMDLYSRMIMGWTLREHMRESLVLSTLRQAIKTRQPTLDLIHHTDRGGQYAGAKYREVLARAEMNDVPWPELLDHVDDIPPATIVTTIRRESDKLIVRGVSHDNGEIVSISVNGKQAGVLSAKAGVVDWEATLGVPGSGHLVAFATDHAGNQEQTAHKLNLGSTLPQWTGARTAISPRGERVAVDVSGD